MNKSFLKKSLATYIGKPVTLAWSKLSTLTQSKINTESELEDYQSEEYEVDTSSQQYVHPYLIDRVEPSVHHIIFSSYIRF